jgi:hypothetical protein
MDNLSKEEFNIKSIIQSNIILISLCIFTVVYIIINYDKVIVGIIDDVDILNTTLISFIIILVLYLLTLEDNSSDNTNNYKNDSGIKKFNFNELHQEKVEKINELNGGNKYKIANNIYSNINDFDNQNIFISQKNKGKYGINF